MYQHSTHLQRIIIYLNTLRNKRFFYREEVVETLERFIKAKDENFFV